MPATRNDVTLPGSYVSVSDFMTEYTGVNTSTLKPGKVARAIARASRSVDRICKQTLYATLDTVTLSEGMTNGYTVDRNTGTLRLYPRNFPIRQVVSIGWNYLINAAPAALDLTTINVKPRYIEIDGYWSYPQFPGGQRRFELAYVNGWAVGTTSAVSTAGGTTLSINAQPQIGVIGYEASLYGFLPGTILEVQDSDETEIVTVLSSVGTTVTLTNPLRFSHDVDTMVCEPAMSPVQEATVLLTAEAVTEKGVGPLALHDEQLIPTNSKIPETAEEKCLSILGDFIAYV